MRLLVPLLLAVVSLGFAPAPILPRKPTAAEADLKSLQGEWECLSRKYGREELPVPTCLRVFCGERATYREPSEKRMGGGLRIVLNPSKSPKVMEVWRPEGTLFYRCLYRIEGDLLTVSFRLSEAATPPPAWPTPDEKVVVEVWRRKRP